MVDGAKLLGEIQAEGLRAAGALVERLVQLVDGPPPVAPDPADDDATVAKEQPSGEQPAVELGAVLPWFELWRDLVERTADTLQRFRAAESDPDGVRVQVGVDGSLAPTQPLVIAVDAAGTGRAEMWLHNGTADAYGALVPHCGPLCDADGNRLECELEIDPPKIDGLPARSSRGFVLSIVAGGAAPGTYRGIVQVGGTAAVWMPVEVAVPVRPSP